MAEQVSVKSLLPDLGWNASPTTTTQQDPTRQVLSTPTTMSKHDCSDSTTLSPPMFANTTSPSVLVASKILNSIKTTHTTQIRKSVSFDDSKAVPALVDTKDTNQAASAAAAVDDEDDDVSLLETSNLSSP